LRHGRCIESAKHDACKRHHRLFVSVHTFLPLIGGKNPVGKQLGTPEVPILSTARQPFRNFILAASSLRTVMPVTSDENGALSIARWRKPDRPPMKRRGR
jgi:hypothetical protein